MKMLPSSALVLFSAKEWCGSKARPYCSIKTVGMILIQSTVGRNTQYIMLKIFNSPMGDFMMGMSWTSSPYFWEWDKNIIRNY
jgi:hypothetical protein